MKRSVGPALPADDRWRAARWPVVSRPGGGSVLAACAATVAFAIVLALCLALFFRIQIESGFTRLFSSRTDGSIEVAILEHWYNVVRGREYWSAPLYFYPVYHGLGYNDGYFLYGLIYAGFRALGGDPFLSSEMVNLVLRAIGFAACFAFLRAALAVPFVWALFGAALFTISDNMALHALHAQLLAVGLAPLAGLLLLLSLRHLLAGARRLLLVCGLLFAVLMSAWLLTAYYMAWFFGLFVLICCTLALLTAPFGSRRALLRAAWAARGELIVIAMVQLATLAPFLWVYVPLAAATGGHDFAEVLAYGLWPVDILQVGAANLIWGRLDALLVQHFEPEAGLFSEHTTGLPLLLLGLFALACGWLVATARDAPARLARLLALAAVLVWLLALQFGDHTLWRYVYHFVPGARGLRVVSRIQIGLVLPVVIAVAFMLSRLAPRTPWLVLAPLCAMLLAEEVTLEQSVDIDRPAEMAFLHRLAPPPPGCRVFYAAAARPGMVGDQRITDIYSHNVDAMVVAEWFHIPTINGFSTFTPPGWDFAAPEHADYASRVARYIEAHGLTGVCAVNFTTGAWQMAP
jgi:hypothetical protein